MINLVYVAGLWDPSGGPLNGFRAFAQQMESKYPVKLYPMSYADKYLVRDVVMLADPAGESLIVVGHSHGADAILKRIDPRMVRIKRTFRALCLLDAKPQWTLNPMSWVRWAAQKDYPLPQAVGENPYIAFHGDFGRGFEHGFASRYLDIGHPDFPGNYDVHAWIENQIAPQQEMT